MEGTCSVEVGLLKKKPCGEKAVAKCANCEIPLCAKHTTSQMSGGKKTLLCPECARAWKKMGDVPDAAPVKKPEAAAAPKPAAAAHAAKAATPPKPAAAPAKPAAAKEEKKEEHKPDDDAPLEFTPSKKPDEK
jgi:hypothetical protein